MQLLDPVSIQINVFSGQKCCMKTHISVNGRTGAAGLSRVMKWLQDPTHTVDVSSKRRDAFDQMCCFPSETIHMKLLSSMKRLKEWKNGWEDTKIPVMEQLKVATCKQRLFDRLLKTTGFSGNIPYLIQYKFNHCDSRVKGIAAPEVATVVDVACLFFLLPWFNRHTSYIKEICDSIPHVVAYTIRTCKVVGSLHAELGVDTVLDELLREAISGWMALVDENSLDVGFSVVNITYKKRVKGLSRDGDPSSSSRAGVVGAYTESVDGLLSLVEWQPLQEVPMSLASPLSPPPPSLPPPPVDCVDCVDGCSADVTGSQCESATYPGIATGVDLDRFWEMLGLPPGREVRKKQQIMSLVSMILPLLPVGGCLAEFCCGGGYVGLLTAFLRRDATVVLVDRNSVSLSYASARVRTLGLENVTTRECDLLDVEKYLQGYGHRGGDLGAESPSATVDAKFGWLHDLDLGAALHACGRATDMVQHVCMQVRAAFVLAPCCYGFIQHWGATSDSASMYLENGTDGSGGCIMCGEGKECKFVCGGYPKSTSYINAGWCLAWFGDVCSRADRTFNSHDPRCDVFDEGARIAMKLIDTDRLLCARQMGYKVAATTMLPHNASCKNHLLVGRYSLV